MKCAGNVWDFERFEHAAVVECKYVSSRVDRRMHLPTTCTCTQSSESDPHDLLYIDCLQSLLTTGWLGSRVVSVLGLRRRRARVQIAVATLSSNSLRQTVHNHCASVHQAAKLVAALLRVAGVTAVLAESNGSLLSGL